MLALCRPGGLSPEPRCGWPLEVARRLRHHSAGVPGFGGSTISELVSVTSRDSGGARVMLWRRKLGSRMMAAQTGTPQNHIGA